MKLTNADIAALFTRLADLLEIDDANPFRIRAYRNAARTIEGISVSLAESPGSVSDWTRLPGIGKEIAAKIDEIVSTGKLKKLQETQKRFPPDIHQLLKLPGLGPKKVRTLYKELGVGDLEGLKQAAGSQKIRQLPGFGKKSEERILEEIEQRGQGKERTAWIVAEQIAEPLLDYLSRIGRIDAIAAAGSFRRKKETVGDLDILASCRQPEAIMDHFTAYDGVERVLAVGKKRSSVLLRSGFQVDLRVVPSDSFGAALHYFTGSQAHNIAIRKMAQQNGYKVNEYGVFKDDQKVAGQSEAEIFDLLGLQYIEPELREDSGEIAAARENRLPRLIEPDDIQGDLHAHTDHTDGRNSLAEMVAAARQKGYRYLAITNHSQHLRIARGMDPPAVRRLIEEIERLNDGLKDFRVFKAMEVDILRDGSLDLPDEILKELDFVIGSVHSDFRLSRQDQTERIIRAMDNIHLTILGHPSGRLINQRPPYAVDLEQIIEAAAQRGCYMELNAHPDRLDLDDVHCRTAKTLGVRIAISTDAHSTANLDYMRLGIGQARRGWLEAEDVLNTRSTEELLHLLQQRR